MNHKKEENWQKTVKNHQENMPMQRSACKDTINNQSSNNGNQHGFINVGKKTRSERFQNLLLEGSSIVHAARG